MQKRQRYEEEKEKETVAPTTVEEKEDKPKKEKRTGVKLGFGRGKFCKIVEENDEKETITFEFPFDPKKINKPTPLTVFRKDGERFKYTIMKFEDYKELSALRKSKKKEKAPEAGEEKTTEPKKETKKNTTTKPKRARRPKKNSGLKDPLKKTGYVLVEDEEALEKACKELTKKGKIAFDIAGGIKEIKLMQLGAENEDAYVLNVEKLGVKAVTKYVKSILETKSIAKIMNNCKAISRELKNQFEITLNNVIDVQVQNAGVLLSDKGKDLNFVKRVPFFLVQKRNYLKTIVQYNNEWELLGEHSLQYAANMIFYLFELHQVLNNSPLREGMQEQMEKLVIKMITPQ